MLLWPGPGGKRWQISAEKLLTTLANLIASRKVILVKNQVSVSRVAYRKQIDAN
jgi:hypothetical protein